MHQGLRRLREGVRDTVAEALSQARSVGGDVTCPCRCGRGRDGQPCPPLHPCPWTHLFWMDLASQPLWPTIWVMFLASHQALLSGNSASLLMGGGAASSMAGKTAPTRTRSIMPVAFRALELSTNHGEASQAEDAGKWGAGGWAGSGVVSMSSDI